MCNTAFVASTTSAAVTTYTESISILFYSLKDEESLTKSKEWNLMFISLLLFAESAMRSGRELLLRMRKSVINFRFGVCLLPVSCNFRFNIICPLFLFSLQKKYLFTSGLMFVYFRLIFFIDCTLFIFIKLYTETEYQFSINVVDKNTHCYLVIIACQVVSRPIIHELY